MLHRHGVREMAVSCLFNWEMWTQRLIPWSFSAALFPPWTVPGRISFHEFKNSLHWCCSQVSELKLMQGFLSFIYGRSCLYLLVIRVGVLQKTVYGKSQDSFAAYPWCHLFIQFPLTTEDESSGAPGWRAGSFKALSLLPLSNLPLYKQENNPHVRNTKSRQDSWLLTEKSI